MENKKNKLPLIIGLILLASCLGIVALGFGGYQIYKNFAIAAASETPFVDDLPISLLPSDTEPANSTPTPTLDPGLPAPDPELTALFATMWETRTFLHDNFLHQPVDDTVLANGAAEGLRMYFEDTEINLDEVILPEDAPTARETAARASTPADAFDAYLPFWEEWNKLAYVELPEDTTDLALMRHALTFMVAALDDPYTSYLDPDLMQQWDTDLSGEYEGIGAWVDVEAEFLTIISPIKNTPAEAAGLVPGDQIIALDGDDMTGIDPNIVLKRVLGPAGTKVILTIAREGIPEPFDVEIIRQHITIPYIESEMLENKIAYVQLLRFYETADRDLRAILQELLAQEPIGLILDLRGNPGGYLHIAVNTASEFIEDGVILYEEFNDGSRNTYSALKSKGVATEIPLVVLVDQGSASASEIFGGAIQDYQRGLLVGQTTFGKGVVQLPITLRNDQGMVRITIAEWLTPSERQIHGIGLQPDVLVEVTDEDIQNRIDRQLDKAIELLLNGQ